MKKSLIQDQNKVSFLMCPYFEDIILKMSELILFKKNQEKLVRKTNTHTGALNELDFKC